MNDHRSFRANKMTRHFLCPIFQTDLGNSTGQKIERAILAPPLSTPLKWQKLYDVSYKKFTR